MIEALHFLRPAETLLLMLPRRAEVNDLTRVTFLDLVLRRELRVEWHFEQTTETIHRSIGTGPKFRPHHALLHEEFLLRPLMDRPDSTMPLPEYTKRVRAELPPGDAYGREYVHNPRLEPWFAHRLFFNRFLGGYGPNAKGNALGTEIWNFLGDLDRSLFNHGKPGKRMVRKLLALRGNIFLLDGLTPFVCDVMDTYRRNWEHSGNAAYTEYEDYRPFYAAPNLPKNPASYRALKQALHGGYDFQKVEATAD